MKNYLETLHPSNNNIIQIGAHDGIVGEEYGFIELIRESHNNVLMVEPVPAYMKLLKQNLYETKSSIRFVESGVRNYNGNSRITLEGGMSSFKGAFNTHPSIEVSVITIDALLAEAAFPIIDLLLLDTEGCEREIIESLDLSKTDVRTIRWEYHNLTAEDNKFITTKLSALGYNLDYCSHDPRHNVLAWKP